MKNKKRIPWNKNPTEAIRKKIRDAAKNRKKPTSRRENHYNWKGGKFYDGRYIYVLKPEHHRAKSSGYVAEHILVIEKKLGRKVKENEVVHHIDGNRMNNKPENLKLFATQEVHSRYHMKIDNPSKRKDVKIKLSLSKLGKKNPMWKGGRK